jgi:Spy/CpxP family protein refolding chaperone
MKPLTCVLAATLLALQAGCAQNPPYRSHHGQLSIEQLASELDLTNAQKTQVEQIFANERAQRQQLRESSAQSTPEERRQQMQALQGDLINRLSAVLTPEQLQKFEQLEQRRRHYGHRFGGYGQDSPPS